MNVVTIRDPGSRSSARIAVDLGFNCFEFLADVDGRVGNVIDSAADFAETGTRPSGNGVPILFPYPNRIRGAAYEWDGTRYELPESIVDYNADNAIHGFCHDRPWRVVDSGDHFVVAQFRSSVDAPDRAPLWPADFVIECRYEVRGGVLRADFVIANPDEKPLPWGLGTHPYLRVPSLAESTPEACTIEAATAECWQLVDCLPTGERVAVPPELDLRDGKPFSELTADDVLTGWSPTSEGTVEARVWDETAGLETIVRSDAIFRELVVFTPPWTSAVCLEPYTCVTDAINLESRGLDTGLRVLPPGGEIRTWTEIRVQPVVA